MMSKVLPGVYRSAIQCFGGYVSSAVFGTQDLLVNALLAIQPGVAPPSIEIMITRGGGTVSGTVSIESIKKGATVQILLVPQFTASTGPFLAAFQLGESSYIHLPFLSPGPYNIYAFSNADDIEYRNPIFLQSLTGGVSVQVEDNSEKTVTITALAR
jgi:hypothetical protein